jgi:outer membrane lipoprotein-sorting protein
MPRRLLLSIAVAASVFLAACGGSSSAPALTDPKDILTHSASSLEGIKSVHVKASVTGKLDPGSLTGTGTGAGATVDLTGSTLEGDIDIAKAEAKLAIAAPNLFGFSADVIVDSGTLYLKSSLTGDKYQKLDTSTLTAGLPIPSLAVSASPDPSAAAAMIAQLKAELDKLPAPTKLADEKIGDVDCYHVQQKVSNTDVPQASDLPAGTVTLDIWSSKADYRPCRVGIAVDGGTQGNLAVTIDLTKYDAAVDIAAPPADQVSDQPFSIPGLTP